MKSGGRRNQVQAVEVRVGRSMLCRENPNTVPTSTCAKKLAQTVNAAKQGLSAAQQQLWRAMVFTPAVLQASRFSQSHPRVCGSGWGGPSKPLTKRQVYSLNVQQILNGKLRFTDIFGKGHRWVDYLKKGAAVVRRLLTSTTRTRSPRVPRVRIRTQRKWY